MAVDAVDLNDEHGTMATIVWRFAANHDDGTDPAARLARLLIRTYTQPGALVADLDHSPVLRAAARATGRRYTPVAVPLSDPNFLARSAGMVAAQWPHRQADPRRDGDIVAVLTTCRRLLAADGCVIITRIATGHRSSYAEDARTLQEAARHVDLTRLHHIVAVTLPIAANQFTYHANPEQIAALHQETSRTGGHYLDLLVFVLTVGRHA